MPSDQCENQDPPAGPPISSMPLTSTSDENISFLVEIQQRHRTKEAEKGVCLNNMLSKGSGASEELISERCLLAQKIWDLVKTVNGDEENTGTSTGLNQRI